MVTKTTPRDLMSLLLISFFLHGCATMTQGSMQQISVSSAPSGATVMVNGFQRLKTPAVLELPRKESHRLEISLEGYHPETIDIRKVDSGMVAGNLLVGGLIGYAIDHSSGAAFRLVPEVVQVTLRPILTDPPKDQASSNGDEMKAEKIETDRPK